MESRDPGPPRIVVINDETTFLDLMRELLSELGGYRVDTVKEWEGAYELVKAERPDAVILDIVANHQELGWSLLELLILDPATRTIPIIICSGAVQSMNERAEALNKHNVLTIAKPFDIDEMLALVDRALNRTSG